jgi:hypothetical protein
MLIRFFGLAFQTTHVTFYLWSPWRATMVEHRVFEAVASVPGCRFEDGGDEKRLHLDNPKAWPLALQAVARVLKGWQEEADPASERRVWRWLLEADADADGYDHSGEPVSLWGFLRLSLERGEPGEGDRGEDIELEGFGLRIWGERET